MKKDRIFISGKVSGTDLEETKLKFIDAEDYVWDNLTYEKYGTELFFKVQNIINPIKLGLTFNHLWIYCMLVSIYNLLKCQSVYMLKDWKESKGARIEHWIAKKLGFKIYYQK